MDDFDNMFNEVGSDVVKEEAKAEPKKEYNNNNSYGKKSFDNKPKYTNVEGKQTINVWDGDRVEPLELDYDSLKSEQKWVTFTLGNEFYRLDDEHKARIAKLAKLLKEKGYKARVVCGNIKEIFKELKDVFGDDLMLVTPWKGYCKELKDHKQYLSSDSNLKAASFYFNNKVKKYNELPAGIKLVKSAIIGSLVGIDNNEKSNLVIIHDRNYDGRRVDFKQSKLSSDYIMIAKPLSLNLFNVADDKGYGDLLQILS